MINERNDFIFNFLSKFDFEYTITHGSYPKKKIGTISFSKDTYYEIMSFINKYNFIPFNKNFNANDESRRNAKMLEFLSPKWIQAHWGTIFNSFLVDKDTDCQQKIDILLKPKKEDLKEIGIDVKMLAKVNHLDHGFDNGFLNFSRPRAKNKDIALREIEIDMTAIRNIPRFILPWDIYEGYDTITCKTYGFLSALVCHSTHTSMKKSDKIIKQTGDDDEKVAFMHEKCFDLSLTDSILKYGSYVSKLQI